MVQWDLKLASGWLPNTPEKFGKILWVIGIVVLVLMSTNLYERIIDKFFPKQPNVINVSGDYIQEKADIAHFGCSMWRGYIKIGIKSK